MLISIKDYAKQNNVTYEAVRKQVARYREELEEHITKDGRQQFLDEFAIAFLDERRQKNPVVIYQQSKDEQINNLENTIKRLLVENNELNQQLTALYKEQAENAKLLANANANTLTLEESAKEKKLLEEQLDLARKEMQKASDEADFVRKQIIIIEGERDKAAKKAKDEHDALIAMETEKLEAEAAAKLAKEALEAEKNRPLTLMERLFGRKKQ